MSLATSTVPVTAQQPPLIDREAFFGDPEIAGAQVSPDGRFLSFLKPHTGQLNVWVVPVGEPFDAAKPLTADSTRPVRSHTWTGDGRYVLYSQDQGGDENFHVYQIDPTAPPLDGSSVPEARDLTPYDGVQARLVAVRKRVPESVWIAVNNRDARHHDLYRLDLRTGERELVFQNDTGITGWTLDLDGNLRLASRMTDEGGTELQRVDGDSLETVYTCTARESCGAVRVHADGRRVYLVTNAGDTDLVRLVLFDPMTGDEELVHTDPEAEVDLAGAEFANDDHELVAVEYVGDRLRVYPLTDEFARDWERLRAAIPEGDLYLGSATSDDRLQIVAVTSDIDPGATYLYDRSSGEVELLFRPYPELPLEHLANMKPVRYPARDGTEIPAYLTLAKGVEQTNLPAVVMPHGGPWARDAWGYDPFAQFLANRGYAVLQPNFRGSTGFGKVFLNAGNEEWGTGIMQHDVTDGAQWLIGEGIADSTRVAIMGGSYGGYATLAGLAFTPELYAAGVSIVGPSSILTLLESIPPYWAPIREVFNVRVGDMDDPADLERMRAQSPLYSATNIQAPLLVIQGANDPRVKKAESDQIVVALRDLGRAVEYVVAPDEGHGFAGRVNRIAMMLPIERFLAQHVGGRWQEDASPEVTERVALHHVDVDTLSMPVRAEDAGPPAESIVLTADAVQPGTWTYRTTAEVMGQSIEIESMRTITAGEDGGRRVWVMADASTGPMGAGADTVWLDAETLTPVRRFTQQGPSTITLTFAADSVKGQLQAGAQEMPLAVAVNGPVFLDGGPLHVALAGLALEPGRAFAVPLFDLLSASVNVHRLEIGEAEAVETAAGTFNAVRLTLRDADGAVASTIWVERGTPNRVVKAESRMPAQMGGGTATVELTG